MSKDVSRTLLKTRSPFGYLGRSQAARLERTRYALRRHTVADPFQPTPPGARTSRATCRGLAGTPSRSVRRAATEQRARRTGVAAHRAARAAVRVQPARGVPDGGQHTRLEGQSGPGAVDER